MKIWGLPGMGRAVKLRGSLVIVKHNDGSYHAQAWPRPRGSLKGPRQQYIQDNFRLMNKQAPALDCQTIAQMRDLAENTIFRPTDLALMLMAGKLWEVHTKDGLVIRPVKIMASEIQTYLDTITTVAGSMLYRSKTGWIALAPGNEDQLLSSGGDSGKVEWVNAPESGVETLWLVNTPASEGTSGYNTRGVWFKLAMDVKVKQMAAYAQWAEGDQYQFSIARMNGGYILEMLWQGAVQTMASADTGILMDAPETPIHLHAIDEFALILTLLSGTATTPLKVWNTNDTWVGLPVTQGINRCYGNSLNPTVGTQYTLTSTGYSIWAGLE